MKIGDKYADLYDGYYSGSSVDVKREINARQSFGHIKDIAGDARFERILDIGSGNGAVLQELENANFCSEFSAVEVSSSGVDAILARKLSRLKEAKTFDGYHIDHADDAFDLGLAVHVLEHVEHERLFLAEAARVSKLLYVEVPLEHTKNIRKAISVGQTFGHINFYTDDTFRNVLSTAGLKVQALRVFYYDLDYEVLLSGQAKGGLKYQIRKQSLSLFPKLAMRHLVYMAGAICSKEHR
jgi:SAM-dependent methyltransferase